MNIFTKTTTSIAALAMFPLLLQAESAPPFFAAKPGSLAKAKERLAAGDKELGAALKKLVKDADKALLENPQAVTEKAKLPPSRDKHDYISLAPYFFCAPRFEPIRELE